MMNKENMMNNPKNWMVLGAVLAGIGVLICTIAFVVLGFDFKKLSTVKYASNTYEVGEAFGNINIVADIEEISFVPTDDKNCKVICYEEENEPHHVYVENNTLMIETIEKNGLQLLNFSISTSTPKITVYLPKNEYELLTIDSDTSDVMIPENFSFEGMNITLDTGDISCLASANGNISIQTDTGDITLSGVSANDMHLTSDTGEMKLSGLTLTETINIKESTGDVNMKNVSCKKFISNGSTGDLTMSNVIATEEFSLERNTGDIEFDGCDAETIYIHTDTGHVNGTLLSEKVFLIETDTGDIDVPKTITGGRCEITTDTGDISIKVQ